MRYELWIDGVKTCGTLSDLRNIGRGQNKPYQIYKVFESKMGYVQIGDVCKISQKEFDSIVGMIDRGFSRKQVAARHRIGTQTIQKILQYNEPLTDEAVRNEIIKLSNKI